jgi:hypothetical protein
VTDDGRIPPGWYPDPEGDLRWYDGQSWTDHVQTEPSTSTASPPPDRRRRRAVIGMLLALLLVIAVGASALVLVLTSDDDDDPTNPEAGPSATTTPPTDEPSETPSDRPTDTSDPTPGDPATVVRRFVVAALAGDCEAAESAMTPHFLRREGGCDPQDLGGSGGGVDYRVGRSSIEPGAAAVPITLIVPGAEPPQDELHYDVRLVVVDGAWKIDDVRPQGHVR